MKNKVVDEALKKAKGEEAKHIESADELLEEDREFRSEAKRLKRMLK